MSSFPLRGRPAGRGPFPGRARTGARTRLRGCTRTRGRRAALVLAAAPALVWLIAPAVSAHPLGNFTVNRYDGLTVHRDHVDDLAVVDTAEIPTLQAGPAMDTDHDGTLSAAEAAAHARSACAGLAAGLRGAVSRGDAGAPAAEPLRFTVAGGSFRLVRGQAGLDTGRLECRLTASSAGLGPGDVVRLASGVDDSRIGWHEITARGDGVGIGRADVPAASVSDELRRYPADLLSDPLDQRRARLVLGAGPGAAAATAPGTAWPTAWYAALDRRLGALTDRHRLTLPVGLLAVLMAMVLGAGHAALPGHGKTIMAAYLAGRQGRPRDAVTVAGTVTLTHTASVLVLGLALSVSSALVGEDVLAWLGTASGLVIVAAGLWLLPSAVRTLRGGRTGGPPHGHGHGHGEGDGEGRHHDHGHEHGHEHGPDHGHGHGHGHGHDRRAAQVPHPQAVASEAGSSSAGSTAAALLDPPAVHAPEQDHDHARSLDHDQGEGEGEGHGHSHDHGPGHHHGHGHAHGLFGHRHHGDGSGSGTGSGAPAGRRRGGLIGIGVAGGLVPSPSALVVLLGSIALGRTAFGVALVVCYGLGMAATLAAAGLLLLRIRDRLPALAGPRLRGLAAWSGRLTPLGTALLILAVGLGTALRALPL